MRIYNLKKQHRRCPLLYNGPVIMTLRRPIILWSLFVYCITTLIIITIKDGQEMIPLIWEVGQAPK